MEQICRTVSANAELRTKLGEMWNAGAEPGEMVDALTDAGVEVPAEKVEPMLTKLQSKRAKVIAAQALDDDALDQVAGGGDGICDGVANCDCSFKKHPSLPKDARCSYAGYCDELLDVYSG